MKCVILISLDYMNHTESSSIGGLKGVLEVRRV